MSTGNLTLTLSEATTGQVADQFDDSASRSDVTLFRFRMWNNGTSPVTIDQLVFHLSGVAGITAGDLSDLKICYGVPCYNIAAPTVQITGDTGTITFDQGWSIGGNPSPDVQACLNFDPQQPESLQQVQLGRKAFCRAAEPIRSMYAEAFWHHVSEHGVRLLKFGLGLVRIARSSATF